MFAKTDRPYKFKYLITGITGRGIEEVYLPPIPEESEILFKKEQKFTRPIPSDDLQEWMDEYEHQQEESKRLLKPDFISPHQEELDAWADREFKRCTEGIHFYNNGTITYLTGDYYKYLTQWQPLFGFPEYRENDKETFYWIKFWEEDPNSYGGLYNTLRREGKSTKMGFWIMNRTSTNFKHLSGMQGEDNTKIKAFYDQMVINPFYKLPYYSKPTYDTTTLQKKGIIFSEPPRRNRKILRSKKKLVLESQMDYRTSEANKYDQAKLHSSVVEEPGKTLTCDISLRWDFIKPCHTLGKNIIGKSFWGTTVEFMDVTDKGGRAYKKICMQSDYNVRGLDGQTGSGLYAALMPADCAFEGCFDEWGYPMREEARKIILDKRKAKKNNPRDYSALIRKYPLSWTEVFYISSEKCEFNSTKLQDRRAELLLNPPSLRTVSCRWQGNVRFSKVQMYDDDNGWLKLGWLPKNPEEEAWLNNIETKDVYVPDVGWQKHYGPKNASRFCAGIDPIDHGVVVDETVGQDAFVKSRRSRPVMLVKRKYDPMIDGIIDQDILFRRAEEKFPYQTGRYIAMMDDRPGDPNVFFERALMVCWLFGMMASCESQKPGLINWFHLANCDAFLQNKFVPIEQQVKPSDQVKGTAASPQMIQNYTGLIATDVEYFCHTYIFVEVIDDDLVFDPSNTREHDYTVSQGWTEISDQIKPPKPVTPQRNIEEYFRRFRRDGSIIK